MIDFREIIAASPNPYMLVDRELRFVWANAAYERAVMRDYVELHGKVMFDAFPPPDAEGGNRVLDSIERAFETGEVDELAFVDFPIQNADGAMESRFWSATHTPFRDATGQVAYVLQHTVDVTELEALRRMRDGAGVVERARVVEQRYHNAEQEVAKLRSLLEQAPGFVAVLAGSEHRFVFTNAAYRRLLGERALVGSTVSEAVPEVAEQGFIAILDQVYATGEPYFGHREKVVFVDSAENNPRETYLEFIFQAIRNEQGAVSGIFIQGHDVTEEVEAEERQRLLINELNHRVKNTLAVVQGLAQQSFGADAGGRFAGFSGRLTALASAHNLLTASTWESADLHDLVTTSLEAAAGAHVARCSLSGPEVTLPPQLAVTMAMIVHELSTNAIKYGALSNGSGTVEIRWDLACEGAPRTLILDWRENGGPPVTAPDGESFGARLIRRGFGGQGKSELHYLPAGVHCRIETRL